jgi:hypothetical protein
MHMAWYHHHTLRNANADGNWENPDTFVAPVFVTDTFLSLHFRTPPTATLFVTQAVKVLSFYY